MDCAGFTAASGDMKAGCPGRRINIAGRKINGGGFVIRITSMKLRIGDMNLSAAGMHFGRGVLAMRKAQSGIGTGWLKNDSGNFLPVTPGQI